MAVPVAIGGVLLLPALELPDEAGIGVDLREGWGTLLRLRWTARKASA